MTSRSAGYVEEMVFGRRYRVTEKIGAGGMADVFKAVDEVLGRTVAVKVLHPRYAADPTFAARFRQEAQAAANLQSPYIVNMYDWGQEGSTYYIVMEYVRGADLKTLIQQRGALDSRRLAEIGAQVCSALSVAHGYDVIHRDIKPHNIMVTPDGSAKVMDFGIARAGNTTMTQTGSVLGTAHYVSPEQAQGRPLTSASDLYSLGVVLYEASTGRLPFDADSPVAVALKQVNEAPTPPRQINAGVDPGLEAVIMRAMAKQPAERYSTAEEMRRDLLSVAQGHEIAQPTAVMAAPIAGAPSAMAGADQTAVMPSTAATPTGGGVGQPPSGRRAPRRRPVWPWVLLAVLLIAAGLGVAFALDLFGTEGTQVPDVVGLEREAAEAAIVDAGFVVGEVTPQFDDAVPENEVIDQSPVASATAEPGTPVDLVVSKGPDLVEVPELIGLSEEDAREALSEAGLTADPQPEEFNAEVEFGVVFEQTPGAGEQVKRDSGVQFVVSRGKRTVTVPKVTGRTRSQAESALREAGLKVTVRTQYSEDTEEGRVMSQNPASGLEVVEGSTVTITVSKGHAPVGVPSVVGMFPEPARAQLESLGFEVEIRYSPQALSGEVTSQDPGEDETAEYGSTVTIFVDANEP